MQIEKGMSFEDIVKMSTQKKKRKLKYGHLLDF
jgi:hypothetical protein